MYTSGHIGVALLLYAPLGITVGWFLDPVFAGIGGLIAVMVAILPDIDTVLPLTHRGITHTVWFVLGMTLVASLVGGFFGLQSGQWLVMTGIFGSSVAISLISHLIADSMTPMGIRPFAPVSYRHYSLNLTDAKNPRANAVLLGTGGVITLLILHLIEF